MEKKYKVEFHVHTRFSKDSILSIRLLRIMCTIKKIDCIAITDHNEIDGAIKYKNYFEKHHIKVIVGEEIFTKDGEIIGLNLTEKIEPSLSAIETVKEIKKQGGFVYIPHPYDKKRDKTVLKENALQEIKKYIDFIEIHNGRNAKEEYSEKQKLIQEKYGLIPIVGSDAHTFYEIGRNYCLLNCLETKNIIEEIKKAKFVTKPCIKFAHLNTKFSKAINLIKKGEYHEIFRIINRKFKRKK